ncbi:MAG: single-stranded-DNA-specific exonuclease RecJ [Clostridia bacterium]|nr:single-stranded-DNA-specific exonuclease RecJ [Clostridia bacterium]
MFSDIWRISAKYNDKAGLSERPGAFDVSSALAKAVCPEDPEGFTDLGAHRLNDCMLMPDVDAAVDRILDAVDTGERVAVFGDYDCDGVCATALMYDFLKKSLECNVIWRVPERKEGYGLSIPVIDELASMGVTLIITVDNGISANAEIDYCDSRGIDVIVTDHHEVTKELPNSIANMNPAREDSLYPAKNICGCVVAYKLCEALSIAVGIDGIENYLPLAAIATVGDIMEMQGENRSIVKLGAEMIEDTMFPGLNALIADRKGKKRADEINAEFVSFYVVPVLNAAGRMGEAADAVRLLLAESEKEALPLLYSIIKLSDLRKSEVERITSDFEANPSKYIVNDPKDEFLFVKDSEWIEGIIGVLAGKLCERFDKNVCVLTEEHGDGGGDVVLRASVRGAGRISVVQALKECGDLFLKFGGHENACGFSIYEKNLGELVRRVSVIAGAMSQKTPAVKTSEAILYLPPECITLKTAESLKTLEPFGEGNRQPVFVTGDIESLDVSRPGDTGKVIRFNFRFRGGCYATGVNFKDLKYGDMLTCVKPAAVVYTLGVNEFNGKRTAQMTVLDIIEGDCGEIADDRLLNETYGERLERIDFDLFRAFHITKEDLNLIFRTLKGIGGTFSFRDVAGVKREAMKKGGDAASLFTWFKLKYALSVFTELGVVGREKTGMYYFPEIREKKDLSSSRTFDAIGTRYE